MEGAFVDHFASRALYGPDGLFFLYTTLPPNSPTHTPVVLKEVPLDIISTYAMKQFSSNNHSHPIPNYY